MTIMRNRSLAVVSALFLQVALMTGAAPAAEKAQALWRFDTHG